MVKLIVGTTLALATVAAVVGGPGAGLGMLGAMAWMLLVLRPAEAGPMIATWSRSRFE
jgi:hypothetical protein